MACRVSLANRAQGLTGTQIGDGTNDPAATPLAAASGYSNDDLVDGAVERPWRSGVSASVHEIAFDLGAALQIKLVACFDVEATGVEVSSVEAYHSATAITGAWTGPLALTLNSRGDGSLSTSLTKRYWKFKITLTGAAVLDVGELWLGPYSDLTTYFAERTDSPDFPVIENQSGAGTQWVASYGDYRQVFDLRWSHVTSAVHDEMFAHWVSAQGSKIPLVMMPDSSAASAVYHGRIQRSYPSTFVLGGTKTGQALRFTESGRAL